MLGFITFVKHNNNVIFECEDSSIENIDYYWSKFAELKTGNTQLTASLLVIKQTTPCRSICIFPFACFPLLYWDCSHIRLQCIIN